MTMPSLFLPDRRTKLGSHTFTAEEILRFARKYDPQPFHVDPEAARNSVLGGLCASGWHTAGMWMRKFRDHCATLNAEWVADGNPPFEMGPSPGVRNMRWIRPVYVDDTITFWNQTKSARESASKPGWFIYSSYQEGINQKDEPVFSFESTGFLRYPAG